MNMEIGKNILKYRERLNMTQKELGDLIGVSPGAVSKWENNKSLPDISLLCPLARILDISVDKILSFENNMSKTEEEEMKSIVLEYIYNKDYIKAKEIFNEKLEKFPNDIQLKFNIADIIFMYGAVGIEDEEEIKNEYLYAISLLDKIILSNNMNLYMIANFIKADLLLKLNRYEEAQLVLDKVWENNIDPSIIQAILYEKSGDIEKGKSYGKNILLSYLGNISGMMSILSRLYIEDGEYDRGINYLKGLSVIEDEFEIGMYSSLLNLANIYMEIGDIDQSVKYFNRFVDKFIYLELNYDNNIYLSGIKLKANENEQKKFKKEMIIEIIDEWDKKELYKYKDYNDSMERLKGLL